MKQTKQKTGEREQQDQAAAKLLTKDEVASFFGVTPRCIDHWKSAGLLPYFKIGKIVRFKMADVQTHLDAKCRVNAG